MLKIKIHVRSVEHRLAVVALSGMINRLASILLRSLIDPKSAMITDQALRGKRSYA
ncbi:DUF2837 family protein [Desulfosporosinus sp. PR]|nr:DUF2837 family protein [Desulfosporosinus sp. PR]MDQ7095150.1 DUF2837 family protein [Desulfosporosinus sp. PR]